MQPHFITSFFTHQMGRFRALMLILGVRAECAVLDLILVNIHVCSSVKRFLYTLTTIYWSVADCASYLHFSLGKNHLYWTRTFGFHPSDSTAHTQNSGPPVSFALGKYRAPVSLSLELIGGASSQPVFESKRFAWEECLLPLRFAALPEWTEMLGLLFVRVSVSSSRQLRRKTRFLTINSSRVPPTS